MNTRIISLIVMSALFIFIGTSSTSTDTIYWSEEYKLTWNDFKGQPDYNIKSISALSSSGLMHSKGCKDGKIIYEVLSYFEKRESWVKAEAYTDHHLKHEQIHFDITELFARKLRRALAEQNFKCGQEAAFEQYVSKFIQDWHQVQHNYDSTSRHSINREVQAEWSQRIEIELLLLDEYRSR